MILKPNEKTRFKINEGKTFNLEVINKKITTKNEIDEKTITIDAIFNKKHMIKKINYYKANIDNELKELKTLSKFKTTEFYDKFPETDEIKKEKVVDENMLDFSREDLTDIYKNILFIHDTLKKEYKQKIMSVNTSFNYSIGKTTYLYEQELEDISFDFTLSTIISFKDKEVSEPWFAKEYFTIDEINLNEYIEKLKENIELTKNPITDNINLNKYDILLKPEIYTALFNTFVFSQIDLENYKKKDNFVYNNFEIDKNINVFSNPFLEYSPYSKLIDDDFINTNEKYLIKNGKVNTYLSGLDHAYIYNGKPTGNANNYLGNVFFEKGSKTTEDLINNTDKGIIITNILGLHTTNSTEGKINVSIDGAIIEKGEIKKIVKNITLNDTFLNLFKNVDLSKDVDRIENVYGPLIICRR